jgi:hypothetical protein
MRVRVCVREGEMLDAFTKRGTIDNDDWRNATVTNLPSASSAKTT